MAKFGFPKGTGPTVKKPKTKSNPRVDSKGKVKLAKPR